jgi:O-antigen ligase/tetratricopeptide (TPR) repeat protein
MLLQIQLVLMPLLFSRSAIEPFEFIKTSLLLLFTILLGALGLAAVAGTLLTAPDRSGAIRDRMRRGLLALREPIALGFLLFLLSAAVSTAGSVSPRISLFGAHDSNAGLLTILGLVVLFFATRMCCRDADDARRLLAASLIGAAGAAAYGLVQAAGWDPLTWDRVGDLNGRMRPFGTLGHPNHLAAFLVMAFPVCIYFTHRAARRRCWSSLIVCVLVGVLSLLMVGISVSRSAWLALVGVLLILGAGALLLGVRWSAGRCAMAVSVVIALGAPGLLLPQGRELGAHIAERARRFTESPARPHIWQGGLAVFREQPLLGCGPDAFQLAFARQRTPAFWDLEWGATPARVHNEPLHILATQGLLGAAAAGLIVLGLVRAIIRSWRATPAAHPLLLVLAALTAAFCIQNVFNFTTAATGSLFVTGAALLSLSVGSARQAGRTPKDAESCACIAGLGAGALMAGLVLAYNLIVPGSPSGSWQGFVVPAGALLLATLAILRLEPLGLPAVSAALPRPWSVRLAQGAIGTLALAAIYQYAVVPIQADRICRAGMDLRAQGPDRALVPLEEAVALHPGRDLLWTELGLTSQQAALASSKGEERQRLLDQAQSAFEHARALTPACPYHHANLGRLLTEQACLQQIAPEQVYTAFDAALARDPANPYFASDAAHAAIRLGDLARARTYCEHGSRLYPMYGPLQGLRAWIALAERRYAHAVRHLEESLELDWRQEGCPTLLAGLPTALYRMGRYAEALHGSEVLLARYPDAADARAARAGALQKLGRHDHAAQEFQLLAQHPKPELAQQALQRLWAIEPLR